MLQRPTMMLEPQVEAAPEAGDVSPAYILGIIRRRLLWCIIPLVLVGAIGSAAVYYFPSKYVAAGKILVQSQQIPTDLVRPIITSLANERMQVIQQRIMTRDNLLALAKKYNIHGGLRERFSGTEIIDFIRERTLITPLELNLPSTQKRAIAFSVGFEYEDPLVALKVANELITMILNEDARSRSEFASETTSFLGRDVQRLDAQLLIIDKQVADLKRRALLRAMEPSSPDNPADTRDLDALKMQLVVKRATLSDKHPDVIVLRRKIAALEKAEASAGDGSATKGTASRQGAARTAQEGSTGEGATLDTLEAKRSALKKEFDDASLKLATARLGESMERGQHSERLEVIEQPTLPQRPAAPNKIKLAGIVAALALMVGFGSAAGREFLDGSIRRISDLSAVIDRRLVVPIPTIVTRQDRRRRRLKFAGWMIALAVLAATAAFTVVHFYPDPDLLLDKILSKVLG